MTDADAPAPDLDPAPDPAPSLTVIVPMRNARGYVGDTLRSVLAETVHPLEVVVIDDGSTDGSAAEVAALNDPRVRLIPGPQRGIAAAVNAGLAAARGGVVIRCDADDLLVPGRIGVQLGLLDDRPDAVAVCGGYETIDARGRPIAVLPTGDGPADIEGELRAGTTRTHLGTFAIRRAALETLGGARDHFVGTEDIDLQLRLGCLGVVLYVPGPVYRYRLHDASSTHTQPSPQREFLTAQARRFVRQRVATGADDLDRGVAEAPPADRAGDRAMSAREQACSMQIGRAWRLRRDGHRLQAVAAMTRVLAANPLRPAVWKQWVWMLVKAPLPGDGW